MQGNTEEDDVQGNTKEDDAQDIDDKNNSPTALKVLCAAKDETSVEFMRPLLNSWAECSVVISC
jgi:hypothetical protein